MKKAILLILPALCCFSFCQTTQAQRSVPLALTLVSPADGTEIDMGANFAVTVNVTNVSSAENLLEGDTIFFNYTSLGSGQYAGYLITGNMAPNQSQEFTLANLTNNNNGDDVTADFCITAIGTAQAYEGGTWENPDYSFTGCSNITLKGNSSTSIADLKTTASDLQIYPNPATNQVNLSIEMTQIENVFVSIKDITGRELKKVSLGKRQITVNAPAHLSLEGISAGVYILDIHAGQQQYTSKLTIQ